MRWSRMSPMSPSNKSLNTLTHHICKRKQANQARRDKQKHNWTFSSMLCTTRPASSIFSSNRRPEFPPAIFAAHTVVKVRRRNICICAAFAHQAVVLSDASRAAYAKGSGRPNSTEQRSRSPHGCFPSCPSNRTPMEESTHHSSSFGETSHLDGRRSSSCFKMLLTALMSVLCAQSNGFWAVSVST